jgi:hypothetical protein
LEEKPTLSGPPDVKLITGCIWHEGHLMRWICHMVGAANKPSAVLQGWRNDMVEKFDQFGRRVTFAAIMDSLGPIQEGVRAIQILPPNKEQLMPPERDKDAIDKVGE